MSSSEETVAQYVAVAQLMQTVQLSWQALEVLKQTAQYTSHQSSLYKKIQEHINITTRGIKNIRETSTTAISESELLEEIFDGSMDSKFTSTATRTLVQMYMSQHRWRDATKAIKKIPQAVWPSFFAVSDDDVRLPFKDVQFCIELAQQLRDCYTYRRQTSKEENVSFRLYRTLRRDRPAGDKVLQSVTQRLIHLYERTRQTDKLVSIHTDVLNDYSKHSGQDNPVVLQQLWTLAELTLPQPASLAYYRRIFEILNKDSNVCDSRSFEPLVIMVTELIKQERYQEALRPCQILFNSLQNPRINVQLRGSGFVRSVYDRYVLCLQMTSADIHVIHNVTVQYRKTCIANFGAQAAIIIHATQALAFIAQGIKQYEAEVTELFESLLEMHSSEVDIDYENIRITLEAIYESHDGIDVTSTELTTQQFNRVITARVKRLSGIRETY
ncbi:hypothetical protein BJX68DRAFT_190859 [Aspergillus pseudodeflectus]|uniref:PCI domain-containing protein n=1 Tax=Aspergillus pseudodeflectus TaxID=176178 RepID=A0ABR4JJ22_9EURO